MRAEQRLPARLRLEGVLHDQHGPAGRVPSPRKGSARGLAGERKGSGTPRKGSAREVQGTAGLLRQYSEQI